MANKNRKPIHTQVTKQSIGYVLTALGLVAGLAWNDAIKALIERLVPIGTQTIVLKFVYALAITAIVVFISYVLTRAQQEKTDSKP